MLDELLASGPAMTIGVMADFATTDQRGKLIIAGIFDLAWVLPGQPIAVPRHHLVVRLLAPAFSGSRHKLEITCGCVDGGTVESAPSVSGNIDMAPLPSHRLHWQFVFEFPSFVVPAFGDYEYRVHVDGELRGEIPFHVLEPQIVKAAP